MLSGFFAVPILVPSDKLQLDLHTRRISLCYEVHGISGNWFNFVTNECVTVNAHYTSVSVYRYSHIIDRVGVRAVDENSQCMNIGVNLNQCTPHINGKILKLNRRYSSGGIKVIRHSNHVHISVPNCADIALVMWVICERSIL